MDGIFLQMHAAQSYVIHSTVFEHVLTHNFLK